MFPHAYRVHGRDTAVVGREPVLISSLQLVEYLNHRNDATAIQVRGMLKP